MNEPLRIVYCDNHVLVVDKPAGILTQPSGTDQISIEALAKQWIKEQYNKPGNVFLEAVHRLDKPVSGIVLFARTSKALSRLQALMRDKNAQKQYLAVVEKEFKEPTGVLEHYLIHDDYQATVVSKNTQDAKLARLKYRVIKSQNNLSLVEIDLETGRYHQIRVQFATIGHPIVGDTKYGSKVHYVPGEIALNHHCLTLIHPITHEQLILKSSLPTSWPVDQ